MNAPFGIPRGDAIERYEARERMGFLQRGWISGLTLANDTTDATNDISIAPGDARSTVRIVDGTASTLTRDQMDLELPVTIIKQLDVAWAPENYDVSIYPPQASGNRSGGRSSTAIGNGTWHAILAGGPGLQPDVILHDSATQASVLTEVYNAGYTAYRRIGSVIRSGGVIFPFTQTDDYFELTTLQTDINASNPGTSAVTRTLTSVPTGIVVDAHVNLMMDTGGSGSAGVLLSPLSTTDETPSKSKCQLYGGGSALAVGGLRIKTNTSAQIRSRLQTSSADNALLIIVRGWWDTRDRNA